MVKRKKKVTKKMLSKAIHGLFEKSRRKRISFEAQPPARRAEKGAVPTRRGITPVPCLRRATPSKPLSRADLEAMLGECDTYGLDESRKTELWWLHHLPDGGWRWCACVATKDGKLIWSGKGTKTRRKAVENLLKKLRSVKNVEQTKG